MPTDFVPEPILLALTDGVEFLGGGFRLGGDCGSEPRRPFLYLTRPHPSAKCVLDEFLLFVQAHRANSTRKLRHAQTVGNPSEEVSDLSDESRL